MADVRENVFSEADAITIAQYVGVPIHTVEAIGYILWLREGQLRQEADTAAEIESWGP